MSAGRQKSSIALAAFARFASGILLGTGLAVIIGEKGGSPFAVSMVVTVYSGAKGLAPVWGALADVTRRHSAVLVATSVLAALAVLPMTVVEGIWPLVSLRALNGVFAVAFSPVMLAVMSERGGETGRGEAVGFFTSARAAGFTGGWVAIGFLLGLLAPEVFYVFITAVSVVVAVAALFISDVDPTATGATRTEVIAEVRRRLFPTKGNRDHLREGGLQ